MVLFLLFSLTGVAERPGVESGPVHRREEQGRHMELQGINYFELKRNENARRSSFVHLIEPSSPGLRFSRAYVHSSVSAGNASEVGRRFGFRETIVGNRQRNQTPFSLFLSLPSSYYFYR